MIITENITQEKIERIEQLLYQIGGGKSWGYDDGNARRDTERILQILNEMSDKKHHETTGCDQCGMEYCECGELDGPN